MTVALRLEESRPESSAKRLSDELRRIIGQYGYHPAQGTIENAHTKAKFADRIAAFIEEQRLESIHSYTPLPRRTFEWALVRTVRKPRPRNEKITIDQINESALVSGCVVLRHGWRKTDISSNADLIRYVDGLKREVYWLMRQYRYPLPSEHLVFYQELCDWERFETLWRAVRDYNVGEKLGWPIPVAEGSLPFPGTGPEI